MGHVTLLINLLSFGKTKNNGPLYYLIIIICHLLLWMARKTLLLLVLPDEIFLIIYLSSL